MESGEGGGQGGLVDEGREGGAVDEGGGVLGGGVEGGMGEAKTEEADLSKGTRSGKYSLGFRV